MIRKNIFLKSWFVIGLLNLSFGLVSGQHPDSLTLEYEASDSLANSLLWEIVDTVSKDTAYLFGTIHMIDKEDFFLTPAIEGAFQKSTKIVFEIDTEEMFNLSSQITLLMKSFMEDNQTIEDFVSDEEYAMIKAHFEKMGLPFIFLKRIKPMILSMLANEDLNGSGGGIDFESYELVFTEMAQEQGKEVEGLETLEFQMSMFDSIPYDIQASMLVESIQSSDSTVNDDFDEMVQLYIDQNIDAMHQMITSEGQSLDQFNELLIVGRNINWITEIKRILPNQKLFIAVGAGHLGGRQGVIRLLRAEGYQVEAVF